MCHGRVFAKAKQLKANLQSHRNYKIEREIAFP